MSLVTRLFLPLFVALSGLVLSPLSRADDVTFSSDTTALPQLYAFHSSYPNRQSRSQPGDRGRGYVYPGAKGAGYVYPGAKGHGYTQQPHQEYNNHSRENYKNGSRRQKPGGHSHSND